MHAQCIAFIHRPQEIEAWNTLFALELRNIWRSCIISMQSWNSMRARGFLYHIHACRSHWLRYIIISKLHAFSNWIDRRQLM